MVALDEELARTNGRVLWLAAFIASQPREALVWGVTEKVRRGSGEFPGTDVKHAAAPSVWLQLEQSERKHLAEVARAMVTLGIDARRLQLLEGTVAQLSAVISAATEVLLDRLGVVGGDRAAALAALPGLVAEQVIASGLAAPRAALPRGEDR